MEDYPSNSRQQKREDRGSQEVAKKQVRRVVDGEVTRRKTPLGKRFRETFFGGDDAASVWHFVLMDVLIPAAKDMVADAVTQGVERTIFPDRTPGSRGRSRSRSGGYTAYNRQYGGGGIMNHDRRDPRERDREESRPMSRQARRSHDFQEIILDKRVEAEEVLDLMFSILEEYKEVSVKELYEMCNIDPEWTDEKWGWTSLRGARTIRTRDGGYLLDLPKPEPLN